MNKLLVPLFIIIATYVQAQDYRPFKVNVSLGYARPVGDGLTGGFLASIEPKYALSSHVELGLRFESAVVVRGVTWAPNGSANSGNVSTRNSAVLTATYFFKPWAQYNIHPFLGVGTGLFILPSAGTIRTEQNGSIMQLQVSEYRGIGGVIRGGIKVGHLVASVNYNYAPTHIYSLANTNVDFASKGSYAGICLGFDIGGSRR